MSLTRAELAAIFQLLMIGRGYSIEVLAMAEANGDQHEAARVRVSLARVDQAIDLLERELVASQPKGSEKP